MTDAIFDTLAVTRQLKAKGFNADNADQAEAITEAVRSGVTGGVATKADIADLKTEFAKCETRLILTMGGMIAVAVAILGILIRWPASPPI
ncbi:MAG: hypothetical protein OXC62_04555 [Aestuariivita sp.]|nr:hypothetical protein [Aestuariivita sp.]